MKALVIPQSDDLNRKRGTVDHNNMEFEDTSPDSVKTSKKEKALVIQPTLEHWVRLMESSEQESRGAVYINQQEYKSEINDQASSDEWLDVFDIGSFMSSAVQRDGFLQQLGVALRPPSGVLSQVPAKNRLRVIRMLDRHWKELCEGVTTDRLRMIYETVRDMLYNVKVDSPEEVVDLKCAALMSLTKMIVNTNMPVLDPRLVKFHVDKLLRTLYPWNGEYSEELPKPANSALIRITASSCLCMIEERYPTILWKQASFLVREAMMSEGKSALKGFPKTSLALMVLADICGEYQDQQERGGTDIMTKTCRVIAEDDNMSRQQRFVIPDHCTSNVPLSSHCRIIISEYATTKICIFALFVLDCTKRMDHDTIRKISRPLRTLLSCSGVKPHDLWPIVHGLIQTGNPSILEFILDTHDALPILFEGRRPCLLEKILARANDPAFSIEQRQLCLRWVLRQHAIQCHENTEILLEDGWMQLLPNEEDHISILSLKVKALAACLKSRIGEPETIMRTICLWRGFAAEGCTSQFSYAIRLLYSALDTNEYCDTDELRLESSLIRSLVHAMAMYPHLVKPMSEFLSVCDEEFLTRFLTGFQAFISNLDDQFEILRSVDEPLSTVVKIKASVLSRASVSGMVRGIPFKLKRGSNPSMFGSSASASDILNNSSRISKSSSAANTITPRENGSPLGNLDEDIASLLSTQERGGIIEQDLIYDAFPDDPIPDMHHVDELNEWLVSGSTWYHLKQVMAQRDLMSYRTILHQSLRCKEICPCGVLRTISNYCWQYKGYHSSHSLKTKECGNAILALAQTAALVHLPVMDDSIQHSEEQLEVSESILQLIDSIQEGFPFTQNAKRTEVLALLVSDEGAWIPSRSSATLASILGGYIDVSIEG
jgi:hypothetical protein